MTSQKEKQKEISRERFGSYRHKLALSGWKKAYVKRIFKEMPLVKNGRFLDVGAGSGFMAIEAVKRGMETIGIDISSEAIKLCRKFAKKELSPSEYRKVKFIVADAEKLPFQSNAFVRVSSVALLEHLVNDKKAIKEMCRVTKKGGMLSVCVPNAYERTPLLLKILNKRNDKLVGHLRHYRAEDLIEQFGKNGAMLVDLTYHSHSLLIINWMLNLFWSNPPSLVDKLWWWIVKKDGEQKKNERSMNFTITLKKL